MSDTDLQVRRRDRLRACLEPHDEVRFAYLYGSVLEGVTPRDLDVALYLAPDHHVVPDPFDYETHLSVELTKALRFPVDVHVLNAAPLGFQYVAVQGDLLFARDPCQVADYLEEVAGQYMEFAHLGHEYLLEVLAK